MYPETDAALNAELLRLLPVAQSFVSASDTTQIAQTPLGICYPPCEEVRFTVVAAPCSLCPSHARGAVRQPLVGRDCAHHSGATPSTQRRDHSSFCRRAPLIAAGSAGRAVRSPHGFRGSTQARRRPRGSSRPSRPRRVGAMTTPPVPKRAVHRSRPPFGSSTEAQPVLGGCPLGTRRAPLAAT